MMGHMAGFRHSRLWQKKKLCCCRCYCTGIAKTIVFWGVRAEAAKALGENGTDYAF